MNRRTAVTLIGTLVVTGLLASVPISGLDPAAQYAVATMAFAAILWITGALPLPVTALLIPVVLTVFGVYSDLTLALTGFADPVVFLLLAGFVLAEALQAHDIDRRVAYLVLGRLGSSPSRLVLAIMVTTAVLSMIISNTATTAMMVPISVSLVGQVTDVKPARDGPTSNLQIATLLGTAYAASLGGVGTLIGTPPNAIVTGQLRELLGIRITFVDWLAVGLPMVIVTLPIAWVLLLRVYPPEVDDVSLARDRAREELEAAGRLDPVGRRVVYVFVGTAALWLLGGLGFLFRWLPDRLYVTLFGGPGASVFATGGHQGILYFVIVGLLAVAVLFVSDTLSWEEATDIDWGTLILLGGGISLANALADTGATAWLAEVTFGSIIGAPLVVVLGAVIAVVILVGELASNTAMAAIIAPLLINIGPNYAATLGVTDTTAAVFLAVAGAIAASYGFALPVATPPNAIAFGAGYMRREHMLRAGVLLDAVVILLATIVISILIRTVWPIVLA